MDGGCGMVDGVGDGVCDGVGDVLCDGGVMLYVMVWMVV